MKDSDRFFNVGEALKMIGKKPIIPQRRCIIVLSLSLEPTGALVGKVENAILTFLAPKI